MARALIIAYTVYSRDGRVKRHAEALAARGDQVDVICLDGDPPPAARGVTVIGIPIPRYRGNSHARYLGSYLSFFGRAARRAVRMSRAHRYDVAVVCTMPDAAIVSALPLRAFGTKLVLDIHDTMPELYREKFSGWRGGAGARLLMMGERVCAAMADRVLAVHDLHADRLVRAGVPRAKIRVVVNSPDHRIFYDRAGPGATADGFTIVCHGTLTRRLGLDVAMQALAIVRRKLADVRLTVIGEGDYLAEIKRLAGGMGLGASVTFKPPVPIERLPAELFGAAAGLVPNRASAATHLMLPVKLLEYAALGIPVICSRLHTIERYLGDQAVSYFEPGDPVSLASAIERLYQRPDRGAGMVEHARRAIQRLRWEEQRRCLFDAIDSTFAGRGAGRINHRPVLGESESRVANQSWLKGE